MPLTIASVVGFIPNTIWSPLKKFLTKDGVVTFDLAFKISTKYTPALLIVGVCLSFANQFVRNLEIDCVMGKEDGGGGSGNHRGGGGGGPSVGGSVNSDLNDYCWNHDTFLVAKALEPEMQGEISYPGVSGYRKDRDRVIRQRYYKFVWMILVKMAVFSFLPYFFWRVRGVTKIKPLLDISAATEDITEHDVRVKYFLDSVGFNETFGIYYAFCKLLATLTPVGEYFYLCGIIGPRYKYYGVEVFTHFLDETAPWPNPMDVLFPKMAKCNWIVYGFGGDSEVKSAICQLPMNNLTQWSFFVYWWWMAFTVVVNILSLLRLSLFMCGLYRRYTYRRFISLACREDVEKGRSYRGHAEGTEKSKKFSKSDIIMVKLSFGDVLVLSFIKRNLEEWEFRQLIRTLVLTKNHVLQLRPVVSKPLMKPPSLGRDKQEQKPLAMGFIMPNSIEEDHSTIQIPTAPETTRAYSDQSTEIITDGREEECDFSDPVPPPSPGWSITIKDPVDVERRSSSKDKEPKSKNKTNDKKNTKSSTNSTASSTKNAKNKAGPVYTSTPKQASTNYNTNTNDDEDWE